VKCELKKLDDCQDHCQVEGSQKNGEKNYLSFEELNFECADLGSVFG
jgi:hypothetical protein